MSMPRSTETSRISRPKAQPVFPAKGTGGAEPTPVDRQQLFDVLLPKIHGYDALLVEKLIFSGNHLLSDAAIAAAYGDIQVDVILPGAQEVPSDEISRKSKIKVERIMSDPKLAANVRKLVFCHPPASNRLPFIAVDSSVQESERLQAWNLAAVLLEKCKQLRTFDWQLCYGVQGDIWTALASLEFLRDLRMGYPSLGNYPSITDVSLPRLSPELQALPPTSETALYASAGMDCRGWTLGKGWNNLESLKVAGLSQNGAKTLSTQLQLLAQVFAQEGHTRLVSLDLSTHFLDQGLLTSIGQYGSLGSLKHLALATTGTRLTADTLQGVLEGCVALESFVLNDGEGRLDKNTWSQIDTWPTSLRSITVEIDESAPHHSWVLHHLASIHHIPFSQLDTFQIKRLVHPSALLPYPPVNASVPKIQRGHEPETIPAALLEAIEQGEGEIKMRHLCLDWWEMGPNELDSLVKACTGLARLRVGITFALVKLVTMMPTTFATASDMEEMVFTSSPKYNLGDAPTKSKQDLNGDNLPPLLAEKLREPDPAIPDSKDLRKFVRRMPKLRNLRWTGRGGKGEWQFTKKTTLVNVSFTSSIFSTLDTWWRSQLDPPFMNYEEPEATSRTLLELAPTPIIASSPIAEYPSLTRSSTSSSFKIPHTPCSPVASKSFTVKDVNSRLDSLTIMPEDEREFPSLRSKHQRSATQESIGSTSTKWTPDLSTSTKRLTIGGGDSRSGGSTRPTALPMLKTVSAPARSHDVASDKVMSPSTGDKVAKGKRNSRRAK